MAPSSRTRSRPAAAQQPLRAMQFGGITKVKKSNAATSCNAKKTAALEEHIAETTKLVEPVEQKLKPVSRPTKRRRDSSDSELECEAVASRYCLPKKVKFQQPTPPRSPVLQNVALSQSPSPARHAGDTTSDDLPEALTNLISLHKAFARALSLHYAHHGSRRAVPLSILMPSMTRLWKKAAVSQQDVERMLAIWEVQDGETRSKGQRTIDHKKGPFRLVTAGVGTNASTAVEYAWTETGTFNEIDLLEKYENAVRHSYSIKSFDFNSIANLPRLIPILGSQTAARQEKINTIRDDILGRRTQSSTTTPPAPAPNPATPTDLSLSTLSLTDGKDTSAMSKKDLALKARTLSLFDRVRAKQAATSSLSSSPTSLLQQRALGRIPDVVNILRLKQTRKLSAQLALSSSYLYDDEASPNGNVRLRAMMKVAFSFDTLVTEIKDSLIVPIAADEVRECIMMLGRECADTWCSVYEAGGVKCVTLQGEGRSGEVLKGEIERMLTAKAS